MNLIAFGQPVLSAPSTTLQAKPSIHAPQQQQQQQLQQSQMQQMFQYMQIPGQGLVAVPVTIDPTTMQPMPLQLVYQ